MKKSKIVGACCWYLGIGVLAVALGVGNSIANDYHSIISTTFKQEESILIKNEDDTTDTEYFKKTYSDSDIRLEKSRELCEEVESEGIVLLENTDKTLPLASSIKKVSLFGMTSANPVYGGTGSGSIDLSTAITAKAGMENAGFTVNPTLWDFNVDKSATYKRTSAAIEGNAGVAYKVNECPMSEYTEAVKSSYAEYSDAAIVFVGRSGGEGSDLSFSTDENADGYLALSANEAALIQSIQDDATFDKIIIVVNSSNAMELGWLKNYSKIKGAIWVGSVGPTGMNAVGKTLSGTYNPSGRLVDTYAVSSKSSPAAMNFGNFSYTNAADPEFADMSEPYFTSTQYTGKNYVAYQEGIYVGYRYYETRYADAVLGTANVGNYSYTEQVTYPFGYGQSYTDFSYSDYTMTTDSNGDYEISVTVKNTGDVAGKTPVQVYMQSPYSDYDKANGIEKSAIELVGFTKTEKLDPKATQRVTITVDDEVVKTYDANGAKTYIQDKGPYYFSVGKNSHDALNNILSKIGKSTSDGMDYNGKSELVSFKSLDQDLQKYSVDQKSKNKITNQFDDANINKYFTGKDDYKYLTRSNWTGTFPKSLVLTASADLKADLKKTGKDEVAAIDATKYTMPTFDAKNGMSLITMKDVDFNDSHWNDVLDNMTKDEALNLVTLGGYKTQAVASINYNGSIDKDGPQGLSSTLVGGTKVAGGAYTSEVVIAATFNRELTKKIGEAVGEDGLHMGVTGWYGPAMNIHRTPFTGRSFEYFSEDPFLSGQIGAAEVSGARSKGMITYIKHLAVNDQDTNRKGLATFVNEQSIREIYLKPFEASYKVGGANAMMESHNRLGATWVGGCGNLYQNVLRSEWGFDGFILSDYVGTPIYQSALQAVINGEDMMLCTKATAYDNDLKAYANNAYVMTKVREACHRILYVTVNTSAMNGISQTDKVVNVTPLWRTLLTVGMVVLYVAMAAGAGLVTYVFFFKKKKEDKTETTQA
ncbi:MAG: glycoside hydrolase family 3 C-terminal domain-containing protein [Bacilli bacterium]